MTEPKRETTLRLLFLRGDWAAIHTLTVNDTTYFGANVQELAASAGLNVNLLRRLRYQSNGERDGVRYAECVW